MTTICIDHDGTFSTNPEAWTRAMAVLQEAGFEVICISSRFPNVPLPPLPFPVYYACGEHKWEFAFRKGINVDIWIDDCPFQIGEHPERRDNEWPQRRQRIALSNELIDRLVNGAR